VGSYPVLVRSGGHRLESNAKVLRVLPRKAVDAARYRTPEELARAWVAHLPGRQVLVALRRWHRTALDRRDRRLNQLLVIAYAPRHDHALADRRGIWLTIARGRSSGDWQLLQATLTPYGPRPSSVVIETAAMTPSGYSRAITRICRGARLFTGEHEIGTRAGAIAVSRDIRWTGRRRLRRVQAVPRPPGIAGTAARWIAVERQLDDMYSATYLLIWNQIERAYADGRRERLPLALHRLVERPDVLKLRVASRTAREAADERDATSEPRVMIVRSWSRAAGTTRRRSP
jgi:hypothetical protein